MAEVGLPRIPYTGSQVSEKTPSRQNTYTGGPHNETFAASFTAANGGAKEVIDAGAGDDGIFADDGVPDQITCGDGNDTVDADSVDSVASDCENVY